METLKTEKKLPQWFYFASLILVIIIWGIYPVITTKFYTYFSPTVFTTMTGFIAAVLCLTGCFVLTGGMLVLGGALVLSASILSNLSIQRR